MTKSNNTSGLAQKCYKLPKGVRTKIARRFGVTEQYVTDVKQGRRNNLDILEAIVSEIENHHKRISEVRNRAKRL